MVYLVTIAQDTHAEPFFAGAASEEEALSLAAEQGYDLGRAKAKRVPNHGGLHLGEWKEAHIDIRRERFTFKFSALVFWLAIFLGSVMLLALFGI